MTTGLPPWAHGVIANGFYLREPPQVEMWTSPNECIERPQIWDILAHHEDRADFGGVVPAAQPRMRGRLRLHAGADPQSRTAANRCGATRVRWNFTGGSATSWAISLCSISGARWPTSPRRPGSPLRPSRPPRQWTPDFFYIYLPHLDYAAQRSGPDSPAAVAAVAELDGVIGKLCGRIPRGLRRGVALAGGRRIRHRRRGPRNLSQPRAPRGGPAPRPLRGRRRTSRPRQRAGRLPWSTTSSPTCSSPKPRRGDPPRGRTVRRPSGDCRGLDRLGAGRSTNWIIPAAAT